MLKRLLLAAFLATAAMRAIAADYTDIWYNPAEPGWGVNLVQSDNFLFATFFIYAQNGSPTWYTAQLTWDGSKFTGGLYATAGTWFAVPWQPDSRSVDLNVTHLAGINATFQFLYTSGTVCTLSGTLVQYGQQYRIPNATYQCSSGLNTAATVDEIKATAQGIEGRFSAASVGGGCREEAQFSAVLQ